MESDESHVPADLLTVATKRRFFIAYIIALIAIATGTLFAYERVIDGDAVGYANAVRVYQGEVELNIPPGLTENTIDVVTAHRILTTFLGIEAVRIFSEIAGSLIAGWVAWDILLFFGVSIVFYRLLERFFQSPKVALIGGLFFAGNYSMVSQGLALFMDIGGWFFYVLSLYWLYRYIESGSYRDVFFAALAIAVGGFFKENSFVAFIPIALVLLYENYRTPLLYLKRIIPLGLLIAIPMIALHIAIYLKYEYVYTYWIRLAGTFVYPSIIAEYIKSIGSLLTFLAPISLVGAILLVRRIGFTVDAKRLVYIASIMISTIPAIMWPAITQRVLFLILPWVIILAGFFIKRYERFWYAFLPVLGVYILAAFTMDSFILDFVNLPI